MKTNAAALDIIKVFEGFRSEPYLCPANVWTIGYGSTRTPDGRPVTKDTPPIDEPTATAWMQAHLDETERQVAALARVGLAENQFGALVSFTYNLGSGALQSSTLRAKLNRGDYEGAAGEFWKWRFAGGRVLGGLVARRAAEEALFRAA